MLVQGRGLLGRAFAKLSETGPDALIFARGVADSGCEDPAEYARETASMEEALGQAAEADMPFVYFAGAPIYGPFNEAVDEDTPLRPVSKYGTHQARAEERIRAHPASHLIIRLPNVVGPDGNPHQLVPSLARQVIAGSVTVQQAAERDVIGVDRVVDAVLALLDVGVTNETVVVATGISTPVGDLATWLMADLGVRATMLARAGGEAQRFRIDLLRSLVPAAADFGPAYPRQLVNDFATRSVLSGRR